MHDLEQCSACGEWAFDGRRCRECGSLSLDYLHDLVREDIRLTEPVQGDPLLKRRAA